MKTKSTSAAHNEIRAIINSESQWSKEETLFLGGALFALEWMLGRKSKSPSKYLPWLNAQAVIAKFEPVNVLEGMINTRIGED